MLSGYRSLKANEEPGQESILHLRIGNLPFTGKSKRSSPAAAQAGHLIRFGSQFEGRA